MRTPAVAAPAMSPTRVTDTRVRGKTSIEATIGVEVPIEPMRSGLHFETLWRRVEAHGALALPGRRRRALRAVGGNSGHSARAVAGTGRVLRLGGDTRRSHTSVALCNRLFISRRTCGEQDEEYGRGSHAGKLADECRGC